MRERFQVSDALYGALLIYAGISTLLPSLVLAKPVDFNVLVGPLPESFHPQQPATAAQPDPAAAPARTRSAPPDLA